jgi:hypothetical protein
LGVDIGREDEVAMVTRQELHQLIDDMPERGLDEAARYLAALKQANGDAFRARLLLAPEDDEPTTPEEDAETDAAWEDYRRGDVVSADELKRKYGLG